MENILIEQSAECYTIVLNRPDKRNALDEKTMDELLLAFDRYERYKPAAVVLLRAEGSDFCAGADLQWMKRTSQMSHSELKLQNRKLQQVFTRWFDIPALTMVHARGNVMGGGIGLLAATDVVLAEPGTRFCFSEVKLGLIPATIAPFVLQRVSRAFARKYMLSALDFNAREALNFGLIDYVGELQEIEDEILKISQQCQKNEPQAMALTKKLVNDMAFDRLNEPLADFTVDLLARVRQSDAAQQRIGRFFEKRKLGL